MKKKVGMTNTNIGKVFQKAIQDVLTQGCGNVMIHGKPLGRTCAYDLYRADKIEVCFSLHGLI